jgi:predicted Rossmann-fold nucleotide-binding protein
VADRTTKDTWTVFKIMGEFVEGFETLRPVWPAVSIFGSARMRRQHPTYRLAVNVARALSDAGFSVITGGGGGIMEAANSGASQGPGRSIGLNIKLPAEQRATSYEDTVIHFNYCDRRGRSTSFPSCCSGRTTGGGCSRGWKIA